MGIKQKDFNKIARAERSIETKYGKEAVINPRSNWTDEKELQYVKEIQKISLTYASCNTPKKEIIKDGYIVLESPSNAHRICPSCKEYSFKSKDDLYMTKFGVCYKCYLKHFEGRPHLWKERIKKFKYGKK